MNWVKLSCKSRTLMCYFKSPVTILWPWQSSKDSNPISISVEHTFSLFNWVIFCLYHPQTP